MRTIRFYATIVYYLLRYGKNLIKDAAKLHSKGEPLKAYGLIDKIASKVTRKMIKISGAKVTVTGIENIDPNETYLFVSNHQGNYDIPLLFTYSPIKMAFVAKQEMRKIPIIGDVMANKGCVFLDRENPRNGIKAIQQGIDFLKTGESLAVFPEGKRSKGMEMDEFKPGAFRLAVKSGVKIAPVVIKGSYKLMEANKGKIKPADLEIQFLNPIDSKDYKDAVEICSKVENLIKEKL